MKFYYTFGISENFPYQGGWVEVIADSRDESIKKFDKRFPHKDTLQGETKEIPVINCSFIYTAEKFEKTEMYTKDNLGARCHEVIE